MVAEGLCSCKSLSAIQAHERLLRPLPNIRSAGGVPFGRVWANPFAGGGIGQVCRGKSRRTGLHFFSAPVPIEAVKESNRAMNLVPDRLKDAVQLAIPETPRQEIPSAGGVSARGKGTEDRSAQMRHAVLLVLSGLLPCRRAGLFPARLQPGTTLRVPHPFCQSRQDPSATS